MDSIEKLTKIFERFPSIGPRQAGRFVHFLLRSSPGLRRDLIDALQNLGGSVKQCSHCMRYFAGTEKICGICTNRERDRAALTVIASDADLLALERSGTFRGLYFVLGGTISLASEQTTGLRIPQLIDSLAARIKNGLKEIILAFPANPEGDATAIRLREELLPSTEPQGISITSLGRGLSTGSELEYADPDTLKSAFDNRR